MTVSRSTPTRGSPTDEIGEAAYADRVNEETSKLWEFAATPLTSVAGTANAITAASDGATIASYATGMIFSLIPSANNTAPATINIDSRGVKSIVDKGGNALAANALVSGRMAVMRYDGTNFRLLTDSRMITISASDPSGGADGDLWFKI